MIDDLSSRFDAGEITAKDVESLLDVIFGPEETDEKSIRRAKVVPGGKIVKFQLIGLNKQAKEAILDSRAKTLSHPVQPEIAPELLDDIPEFDDDGPHGPDYVPDIKSKLGIIAAVRMFGKEQVQIKSNRSEGVKVRCPFDHHRDQNPSAWVNTDKNTWFCGKCQVGGDVIDFYAARRHNLAPSDFHRSAQFRTITEEMADALGIEVYTPYDTKEWASPLPDQVDDGNPDVPLDEDELMRIIPDMRKDDPPIPDSPEASEPITVTEDDMFRGVSFAPGELDGIATMTQATPQLNVANLPIPDNTFLSTWLNEIRKAYPWVPEEYLLIFGLQAVGVAAGHNIVSRSSNLPLTGSLLVAIVGPSGFGKTTAANFLSDLFQTSGPAVKFDPGTGRGVKLISGAVSPEALIQNIKTEIEDPSNATGSKIEVPTTGWLFEDELATFISRSRRVGGGHLKQRLMQFHDFSKKRTDREAVIEESGVGSGRRVVHDSFLSASFLTQTEALRSLAEQNDLVSGFLNRIIPIFGHQTETQHPFQEYALDPNPFYKSKYDDLWKVCHDGCTIENPYILPFAANVRDFYDNNPFFTRSRVLINEHPIYARLDHLTFRLALLFAVNEHARDCSYSKKRMIGLEVEKQHFVLAVMVMEALVEPGLKAMMQAVLANEVNEYVDQFVDFIRDQFQCTGKFPAKHKTATAHFNKKFPVPVRKQGQDYAIRSGLAVEIYVTAKAKGIPYYAIPEGKYTGLVNQATYKAEEIYK